MAYRPEDFIVSPGWRPIYEGLGETTRRDPGSPKRWRGLTACDRTLLEAWVGLIREDLLELHTDVMVGCVPEVDEREVGEFVAQQIADTHPLRIDAVVRRSSGWYVCELKGDAGYKALGQVLCYLFYAARCIGVLREAGAVVVTDRVQEALRPVFAEHGVEVVEVGDVLWGE